MAQGSGGRPSKQVKIIGSAKSKINVPYFNQQQPGATAPNTVDLADVNAEQQQQLQDKGGA